MEIFISNKHIVIAAFIHFSLGGIWYSPFAFGKTWEKLIGIPKDKLPPITKGLPLAFASSILISFGIAFLIHLTKDKSLLSFILLGIKAWLFFVASTTLYGRAFLGKPWKLLLIDNGYFLVGLIFICMYFFFMV